MSNLLKDGLKKARSLDKRAWAVSVLLVLFTVFAVTVCAKVNTVEIVDGQLKRTILTMDANAKDILKSADIALSEDDVLSFSGVTNQKGTLQIIRAFPVNVMVDGVTKTAMMVGGNVSDALTKLGITLNADDTVSVSTDTALKSGMTIDVSRVGYQTFTKTEEIPYTTTKRETSTLEKGTTKIASRGSNGERTFIYRQKIVDGKVESVEQIESKVTKDPVEEEVLVGTKVKQVSTSSSSSSSKSKTVNKSGTLQKSGRPVSYKRYIDGVATAYSSKDGLYTATGKHAQVGYVAVDPRKIPLGTKLYIESLDGSYVYGYCEAQDTGGAMMSGRVDVDLFMASTDECYAFGVRDVRIYILD